MGSQKYEPKMKGLAKELKELGHQVMLPAFDYHRGLDAHGTCAYNRGALEWCDAVYFYWDQRSPGAIFDFGMIFYARKPFRLMYLESKTFANVMISQEVIFEHFQWPA